ncbi:MarR family transcriptional regulator [Citrobacter sedlakii]|uniref:MarR family transcriptional regulator n=1 Tax=Citrobacter sedlakii TaxID=67826 RepID=A0ABS0ZTS7_9ENTR|nr:MULTISPECIES: hypothetical protein [Citrobacter]EKJ8219607.1 MarR family transcriptional regulator [Citrobacter sedlakii]KSY28779.1 hypothetical protein APU02_12530 [Citrobacter sp. 50677481]MBJ8382216.1 MarR family transcriptional regulator [Citrobacter sedlakii]MBM9568177.1 MarR family transcriptional regulator [Citrobacter sedlakii]QUC30478.1 MarR family transcriptional regulator [Citrobacter sedlakii]
MISKIELGVLKVMALKEGDWNWYVLDRVLSTRNIPGFGYVPTVVNRLVEEGFVDVINDYEASRQTFIVSERGREFLKNHNIEE